jgi:hypothetical protein
MIYQLLALGFVLILRDQLRVISVLQVGKLVRKVAGWLTGGRRSINQIHL